ncbi:MAG TPA: oxidoreductase [Tepidisphaeraceae bacterium]|jgi:NAD(P)-dependent dehydrogenase (short-subunit alcohol dehydrogenase family)|nr:oxidoreductase [Tepidisphaeraceae bacterium]
MSSKQAPIHSGFGPTTTARQTLKGIDLAGKVAIVTGGYAGLGLETTRALAEAGARVIVPARSPDKARKVLAGIPRVEQSTLDLLDPSSIDAFANEFLATGRPLHMLINNAGIMATPLMRDARGYESQFSANHLGHFQLTVRLWPALRRAGRARVVSLSSRGHQRGGIDFDDPNFLHRPYDRWQAYGQSKTANVLFAVGLDRRGEASGIRAFAVHPGGILTDLARHLTDDELRAFGLSRTDKPGFIPAGRSVAEGGDFKTLEQGAATTVWCATSPQLDAMGGVYCQDVDLAPMLPADSASNVGVREYAIDPQAAERLGKLSEELTGVKL